MNVLRTPDERFTDLPDFPYRPSYAEVDDGTGGPLRVAFLDEGPPEAEPVLLMHGEPSWSFLYRSMVKPLVDAGHRVIAPDLVGFGRSDKPSRAEDYTYARHVGWMRRAIIEGLDLSGICLVGQDWGGLIGLRLLAEDAERFARVVVANTGLPTGDDRMSEAFDRWQRFSQTSPAFDIGRIVTSGCATQLPPEVVAAYEAPFPTDEYKAGARVFPSLVPTRPDDPAAEANRQAWKVLEIWERPFLTAFSDRDPITGGGDRIFQRTVPGARGQAHITISGAGHFLQEDRGAQLAGVVADFIARTSGAG
jgi:haloalkane dehalogenase